MTVDETIRSQPCLNCYVCGTPGEPLYQNLRDRLFGTPGKWNLRRCPNSDCGMIWLDPMPVEEDIAKAYKNYFTHSQCLSGADSFLARIIEQVRLSYYAHQYGYKIPPTGNIIRILSRLIFLSPRHRARWDSLIFYLKPKPQGRLLEVGCGSGKILRRLEVLGWTVEGLDPDLKAVRIAEQRGLSVRCGTLAKHAYPERYFDAVVMNHVIEHVFHPKEIFQECARILKPDGCLIAITPNANSWGHGLFRSNWRGLEPPRHLHIFTPPSIRKIAFDSGFDPCVFPTIAGAYGIFRESFVQRAGATQSIASPLRVLYMLASQGLTWAELFSIKHQNNISEEIVIVAELKERASKSQKFPLLGTRASRLIT